MNLCDATKCNYDMGLLNVFKCLHGIGPSYLSDSLSVLTAADLHHDLRSATRGDLCEPRTRTRRLGPRSFRISGPAVWNSLPVAVRDHALTISQFKSRLKHHLFCLAYHTSWLCLHALPLWDLFKRGDTNVTLLLFIIITFSINVIFIVLLFYYVSDAIAYEVTYFNIQLFSM